MPLTRWRTLPRPVAWTILLLVSVASAVGYRLFGGPRAHAVRGALVVVDAATVRAGQRIYVLRGIAAPARGTIAGDCAARTLQSLLRSPDLRAIPTGAMAGDTMTAYLMVGDTLPLNLVLVAAGVVRLGPLPWPHHPFDSFMRIASADAAPFIRPCALVG